MKISIKILKLFIILVFITSCNSNNKTVNSENNINFDSLAIEEIPYHYFPTELIVVYDSLPKSFNSIINIYNGYNEPDRKLITKYKIGQDIILTCNIDWVIISEKPNGFDCSKYKIHFISFVKINNDIDFTVKEYSEFDIGGNCDDSGISLMENTELVSVFKSEYDGRQFIVVISKNEDLYYTNVYESVCSASANCDISELFVCEHLKDVKNKSDFDKYFPLVFQKNKDCKSPAKPKYNQTYYETKHLMVLHFVDSLSNIEIRKQFDFIKYYDGINTFKNIDKFYTIGKNIKTKFHFDYLFFRENNGVPEICFARKFAWWNYEDDNILYIEKYDLPINSTIVSVFAYTHEVNVGYKNKYIIVITKNIKNEYQTSLFWETCGNRYCNMEKVAYGGQKKLFKNIKTYEDFIEQYPKIWEENGGDNYIVIQNNIID